MAKNTATGLLDSLKQSPATKHLVEQARGLGQAHAGRLSESITDRLSSATERIERAPDRLPAAGAAAKRMLQGRGALGSAVGAAASSLTAKAKGLLGGGDGGARSAKSIKSTHIEESIDVGAPVADVYRRWRRFEDFSEFMKGVESVEQASETESNWRVKVFASRRTWKATIQDDVPNSRIAWTSEGAKGSTTGVVTFHPLTDDLTRVLVTIEYFPSGLVERTGNLWRAAGRRVRLDLKNFRHAVMMQRDEKRRRPARRKADHKQARGTTSGSGTSGKPPAKKTQRRAAKPPRQPTTSRSTRPTARSRGRSSA
jgi:uncharacterized membrane protein